jgi:hypothetical protein
MEENGRDMYKMEIVPTRISNEQNSAENAL